MVVKGRNRGVLEDMENGPSCMVHLTLKERGLAVPQIPAKCSTRSQLQSPHDSYQALLTSLVQSWQP